MVKIKNLLFLFLVAGLYACGSSGGGSTPVATTPTTPSVPDPLFVDQWHLKNTGQAGNDGISGTAEEDINVEPAWNRCGTGATCRGEGIRIAVVDDGLEIKHEDLAANIIGKGFNFLDGTTDPTPSDSANSHGTSVAGLIAARDLNGLGGRGVAPRANLVGYNLVAKDASTTADEAKAMTLDAPNIHVSNNSWGPADDGQLHPASTIWEDAIDTGVKTGRGGLGTVYIWSGGNGRTGHPDCTSCVDNSNYDGMANYFEVIAVAALNDKGTQASYSESGANLLVSATGGEFCDSHTITTTDLMGSRGANPPKPGEDPEAGNQNYTRCFNGTSSAAPIVSGVVALVLQANPNLGFRDVRAILARSARKNDPTDLGWAINGAGMNINHKYGFGVVDADAAVQLAKNTTNLGPRKSFISNLLTVNIGIPDNDGRFVQSTKNIAATGINSIESIEIRLNASEHPFAGDLEVSLINLSTGTISILAETHNCPAGGCGTYSNWVFSTTRHMGEIADGLWKITVHDKKTGNTGTFESWAIAFHGT